MIPVVRSLKGKDKGLLFAVVKEDETDVWLVNGKLRPLERPKRKNKKHVLDTGVKLEEHWINTNRSLRKALMAADR